MDFQLNNLEVDLFLPIPKPRVRYFGAAAIRGCPLANITQMRSSEHHYLVVIELPQVQVHFRDGEVEWTINSDDMVTIEGELIRVAVCADFPLIKKRKFAHLRPTNKWGMFFYLPGPVDLWTTSVIFTSETTVEILVRKTRSVTAAVTGGPSRNDSPPLSPDPISFAFPMTV